MAAASHNRILHKFFSVVQLSCPLILLDQRDAPLFSASSFQTSSSYSSTFASSSWLREREKLFFFFFFCSLRKDHNIALRVRERASGYGSCLFVIMQLSLAVLLYLLVLSYVLLCFLFLLLSIPMLTASGQAAFSVFHLSRSFCLSC